MFLRVGKLQVELPAPAQQDDIGNQQTSLALSAAAPSSIVAWLSVLATACGPTATFSQPMALLSAVAESAWQHTLEQGCSGS